jgi:hypothetical protein
MLLKIFVHLFLLVLICVAFSFNIGAGIGVLSIWFVFAWNNFTEKSDND